MDPTKTPIYYGGDAGANVQTGLTEGYTDNTGGNTYGYKTHSGQNYFNTFVQFENEYQMHQLALGEIWKYIEIPNLEDNTVYPFRIYSSNFK